MCEHPLTFCRYLSSHFLCFLSQRFNSSSRACCISSLITTKCSPLIPTSMSLPRLGPVFPSLCCAVFLGEDQRMTASAQEEGLRKEPINWMTNKFMTHVLRNLRKRANQRTLEFLNAIFQQCKHLRRHWIKIRFLFYFFTNSITLAPVVILLNIISLSQRSGYIQEQNKNFEQKIPSKIKMQISKLVH